MILLLTKRSFIMLAIFSSSSVNLAAQQSKPGQTPRLTPDLERIQKSLGGSVVDRFTTLRANDEKLPAAAEKKAVAVRTRQAIEALRKAAIELDAAANRLEGLELYRQADALRGQAQRLRIDARNLATPDQAEPASDLRPAVQWANPQPAPPTLMPTPAPALAPAPEPANPSTPSNPQNPQNAPSPALPTPQPE